MATIVLSALGTLVGGPVGGAIGALVGQQVDRAVIGTQTREGPRLKELAVTTSSYGAPIPRHLGRIRAPGTIIWSTDLVESSETSGGGKGQPSVRSYSYAISFAVALASRPIQGIGRIWADGNLLRGAAGDLKTGGSLRLYRGHGDQAVDPLIASDQGAQTPAFRQLAYAVFESLQLEDFGNRIPALTFEIIADGGGVSLLDMLAPMAEPLATTRSLDALVGYSHEGGALADNLAVLDTVYPMVLDAGGAALSIDAADARPETPPLLPEPAAAPGDDGFGTQGGRLRQRESAPARQADTLRYYDVDRDFQAGLQRADGRARAGRSRTVEFPGALAAADARRLTNQLADRGAWARDTLSWRMAELDPQLGPGKVVRAPGTTGDWLIENWEWREQGVELELRRLPHGPARQTAADPGQSLVKPDLVAGPTILRPFELPWDGSGDNARRALFAATSSQTAGWRGAALYAARDGQLAPLGPSGSARSVVGTALSALAPSTALLFDRMATMDVELAAADFALANAAIEQLAQGANRALLGEEIIQFAQASPLGGGVWRLQGLLRGRGGSEASAMAGHAAGEAFILLDGGPVALDPALVGDDPATKIVAIGLGDSVPASAAISGLGSTLRPLTPVHGRAALQPDGSMELGWTRRARGAWSWNDGLDIPLNENAEAYLVGIGPVDAPVRSWNTGTSPLTLPAPDWAAALAAHPGAPLWVRQLGSHASSDPLLLTTIP